jgi:hypothetical protein
MVSMRVQLSISKWIRIKGAKPMRIPTDLYPDPGRTLKSQKAEYQHEKYTECALSTGNFYISVGIMICNNNNNSPLLASAAQRSAIKFPGSTDGSCRWSPSRTIFLRSLPSTRYLRSQWKSSTDTMEHSSTATICVSANFQGPLVSWSLDLNSL